MVNQASAGRSFAATAPSAWARARGAGAPAEMPRERNPCASGHTGAPAALRDRDSADDGGDGARGVVAIGDPEQAAMRLTVGARRVAVPSVEIEREGAHPGDGRLVELDLDAVEAPIRDHPQAHEDECEDDARVHSDGGQPLDHDPRW